MCWGGGGAWRGGERGSSDFCLDVGYIHTEMSIPRGISDIDFWVSTNVFRIMLYHGLSDCTGG